MEQVTAGWMQKNFRVIEWLLAGVLSLIFVIAWWPRLQIGVTLYSVFPLLGLLAFGLMWTHFIVGALRRMLGMKSRKSLYWRISSGLVLALIILHPLLLNIGLVRDGVGLPPGSYQAVYGALAPWLTVGMVALLVFLAFELHRWFGKKKWWRWVELAQVAAMIAIFSHALNLGQELARSSWFVAVWWSLGATFAVSVLYTWWYDFKKGQGV